MIHGHHAVALNNAVLLRQVLLCESLSRLHQSYCRGVRRVPFDIPYCRWCRQSSFPWAGPSTWTSCHRRCCFADQEPQEAFWRSLMWCVLVFEDMSIMYIRFQILEDNRRNLCWKKKRRQDSWRKPQRWLPWILPRRLMTYFDVLTTHKDKCQAEIKWSISATFIELKWTWWLQNVHACFQSATIV